MSELNIPAESIRLADGTALIKDGAINPALIHVHLDGISISPSSVQGELGVLEAPDGHQEGTEHTVQVSGFPDPVNHAGRDGQLLLELRIGAVDGSTVRKPDREILNGETHNDSSAGDVPAATGLTDRVEVAARRGDDSSPDGHANSADRIIRQLAELQRSVLDVLSWWDIVHGDPASEVAEGFLADAIAALRKEVRR